MRNGQRIIDNGPNGGAESMEHCVLNEHVLTAARSPPLRSDNIRPLVGLHCDAVVVVGDDAVMDPVVTTARVNAVGVQVWVVDRDDREGGK